MLKLRLVQINAEISIYRDHDLGREGKLTEQLFLKISALFFIHSSSSSDLLSRTGPGNRLGVISNEIVAKDLGPPRPEIESFSAATLSANSELKFPTLDFFFLFFFDEPAKFKVESHLTYYEELFW